MELLNMAGNAVGAADGKSPRRQQRLLLWLGVVAGMLLPLLLLTYQSVVRGAVLSGESRRAAVAAHAQEVWRCKTLPSVNTRQACLWPLQADPRPAPVPPPSP
jgi:hypothetical protein